MKWPISAAPDRAPARSRKAGARVKTQSGVLTAILLLGPVVAGCSSGMSDSDVDLARQVGSVATQGYDASFEIRETNKPAEFSSQFLAAFTENVEALPNDVLKVITSNLASEYAIVADESRCSAQVGYPDQLGCYPRITVEAEGRQVNIGGSILEDAGGGSSFALEIVPN